MDAVVEKRNGPALALAVRWYCRRLWADRRYSIAALLLPAFGNICIGYLPPLVVARLLARTTAGASLDLATAGPYVLAFGGFWALGEGCWRLGIFFLNRTDGLGMERIYDDGFAALLRKDLAFFHDTHGGSTTKRMVGFASQYEEFADTLSFGIAGNLLTLFFAAAVLWRFDPLLVLVLLGLLAVTALLVAPLIRRRQRLVDEREALSAAAAGHVADVVTNIDAVRAHAAEGRELDAHRASVARWRTAAIRSWDYSNTRIDMVTAPMSVAINTAGFLLALTLGDALGVERVFVTFTYFVQATRIVFEFNELFRRMETVLTEAAQLTALLLEEPTITDPADPEEPAPVDRSVVFEHVRFTHGGAEEALFEDLHLAVAGGEKVGIVGHSGGGKSTMARLLLRLIDVDGGRVLVGGQDARRLRQADLRAQLAYVPQDPVLFHRSLNENIAFGRPDASQREVEAAARAAHAHDFIAALPSGYDTLVGERGVKLSGGQRQRVAIARAILRDAPILVLDEATSALDSDSEALIQDALLTLLEGRTALVVAHRLSTVRRMDRLVVVEAGRVVESGGHDELLARPDGVYAQLWARQSGGFLLESGPERDPATEQAERGSSKLTA